MTDELFDIYFSGKLLPDADPQQVRENIAKLFKAPPKTLDSLFSGKAVRIKKSVDMEKAVKYRVSFRNAGALVDIRPAGSEVPATPPSPTQADSPKTKAAPVKQDLSLAMPGVIMDDTPEVAPASIDDSHLSMGPANQGSLEEFAQPVEPAPLPDISAMDFNKSDEPLDNSPEPETLDIDIHELEMVEQDTPLDETPPPEAANIDTSSLSASEANTGSLEEFSTRPEPQPLPDISKLKLED